MVSDSTLTGADVQDGSLGANDLGESVIRRATAQATTSGTFREFTGGTQGAVVSGGFIDLAGALNYMRIVTANGADTFDAGAVNISWE